MTVKELREKLVQFPDQTTVVVYWEDEGQQNFFGVEDLSMPRGTGMRDAHGKPGFKFDESGPATWVFINVSPE
ncbi:MAG: hypothetical protein WA211_10110 [Candidatus Acidiferrales bacterium]